MGEEEGKEDGFDGTAAASINDCTFKNNLVIMDGNVHLGMKSISRKLLCHFEGDWGGDGVCKQMG